MEVRLRPMRGDEWDGWRSQAVDLYTDDMMRLHVLSEADAREMTIREFERLLPDRLHTEGHHLLVAEEAASRERVGYLWYGPRSRQLDPSVAWLYDLYVEAPMRGRGIGRELLRLLETEALATGISRIELNVFGDNDGARHLYEAAGYTEMARQMAKNLDG